MRQGRGFARAVEMVKPLSALKQQDGRGERRKSTNLPISIGRSMNLSIYQSGYQPSNVYIYQSINLSAEQSIYQSNKTPI